MLVYVSYSKYKIFGLCTGDCSLFIFVIYQKGLDRREGTSTPKVQGGVICWGMCQKDVTYSWLVLSPNFVHEVVSGEV